MLHADIGGHVGWDGFRSWSEQPFLWTKTSTLQCIWKLEGTRWLQNNSRQTERAWLPLIARYRKRFVRSLLPQLLVLALSLARADLSSDDPSRDLPKAVWEIEGLTLQRPDSCGFKRWSTTCWVKTEMRNSISIQQTLKKFKAVKSRIKNIQQFADDTLMFEKDILLGVHQSDTDLFHYHIVIICIVTEQIVQFWMHKMMLWW